jgi:hypothetical protein
LPILAEYKAERVTWSKHRYNPRVFLVKLPLNTHGVQSFREWAKSGSPDTTAFNNDLLYDSADYDDYADDWDYDDLYDDDLDNMEELCKHVEEKFEKKERRKS